MALCVRVRACGLLQEQLHPGDEDTRDHENADQHVQRHEDLHSVAVASDVAVSDGRNNLGQRADAEN